MALSGTPNDKAELADMQVVASTQQEDADDDPARASSPSKRSKRDAAKNPDEQLDELLRQRGQSQEIVPAWATALQSSIQTSLADMHELVSNCHTRLVAVEAKSLQPAQDPRVDSLAAKVEELSRMVAAQQNQNTEAKTPEQRKHQGVDAPNDPWAAYHARTAQPEASMPSSINTQPPLQQSHGPQSQPYPTRASSMASDTDYNHVVVGGWDFDTPKRIIVDDMDRLMRSFQDLHTACVERSVVYGPCAQVGHIYLKPLSQDYAADRFYLFQELYSNKIQIGGGSLMWLSPSRTAARRSMNKNTRRASDFLLSLLSTEPKPEIEVGWSKQGIWLSRRRVAAKVASSLMAGSSDKVISRAFDGDAETTRFYFNLSALQALSGVAVPEIEIKLQSFQN